MKTSALSRQAASSAQNFTGAYSITIDRFSVRALIAMVARCGGYDGGFQAEITITTNSLDNEGFVVHNEKLLERVRNMFRYGNIQGEYREETVVWRATCEQLTSGIANIAAGMIPKERLVSMTITVFNHLGSTKLEWEQGDSVPKFPRRATAKEIEETQRHNREQGSSSAC